MRIGLDWGGSKLEVIALDEAGVPLVRERVATPQGDYHACVMAARDLVLMAEAKTGQSGSLGIGIPGAISPATGLVKNANSTWLNGKPLLEDMKEALSREVRIENDANCFAVSEAVDGAGEGSCVVAGIIIGTGCGSGIAINGKALSGRQGIAGEFGHAQLPAMKEDEFPGPACWCGRRGCVETLVSGPGLKRSYERVTGKSTPLAAEAIVALNTQQSIKALDQYCDQLARGLSLIVNILDPDVIVLGGGMSNIDALYERLPALMKPHVFTDHFNTPIVRAHHGDSSGVRGAAWLWQDAAS